MGRASFLSSRATNAGGASHSARISNLPVHAGLRPVLHQHTRIHQPLHFLKHMHTGPLDPLQVRATMYLSINNVKGEEEKEEEELSAHAHEGDRKSVV